ncbi:MAG: crotonase/enoyl-CoA hydratase family protein, partial [Mariprofundus sp.]
DKDGLLQYATVCIDTLLLNYSGLGQNITTISLVQGDALGGGLEYALSSHVLIAEKGSKMGFPEVLFNLFPGVGAYSLLSRKIGEKKAEEIILGGRLYPAEEMHAMGIVDILADEGQGEMAVYNYINKEERSLNGIRAFRQAKMCTNPVTRDELESVAEICANAALQLRDKDLRLMERLVKRQSARVA